MFLCASSLEQSSTLVVQAVFVVRMSSLGSAFERRCNHATTQEDVWGHYILARRGDSSRMFPLHMLPHTELLIVEAWRHWPGRSPVEVALFVCSRIVLVQCVYQSFLFLKPFFRVFEKKRRGGGLRGVDMTPPPPSPVWLSRTDCPTISVLYQCVFALSPRLPRCARTTAQDRTDVHISPSRSIHPILDSPRL